MADTAEVGLRQYFTDKFKASFEKKWRENSDGCWIWTAGRDKDDYGQISVGPAGTKGRIQRAHRISYMLYTGEDIPDGMDIDHTCHMRRCVKPEHLEIVTHQENMKNLRVVEDWAEDDEDFEKRNRRTTPEIIMEEALEILSRSAVEEKGRGYPVAVSTDAPWRLLAIKDGMVDSGKTSRLKMFLDVVKLGVDWKVACKYILEVSTFAVQDWSQNPDWREDFTAAKKEGRKTRYSVLEERHIDEMERKIDFADFKDVADSLKKLREQDEDRIAAKKGQDNNSGPNITIVLPGLNSEKALRALVEMGDEIEAEFSILEPQALKDGTDA